ncbi:uncharacterized protein LOC111341968, partial [Stylophora pistillata]|uniref:uncharacterized protein LOC111341968 n=1 Tax=Stylophora pistillata TaxID=50429 RepID=UPI000C04E7C8
MKRASKDELKKTAGGGREWQGNNDNGDPPECSVHLPDLSDLPSAVTVQHQSQPDVLLVTVEDCEFLSCYAYLKNPLKHYVHGLGYVYFGIIGDEEHEHVKVGLMKCYEGSIGPGSSLITVKDAVPSLQPKAVISVGYCSGMSRENAKLGDVVVCAKLTTYAPRIVLDTEEKSTGTRTLVSRNFLHLIKNVADGWKAPLKNPETGKVGVHTGGEFLSGPERINADWRCAELLKEYPLAIAIEQEGEGVFTATFDLGIEWLLVKGIADFADGTDTRSSWKRFASVMAASVVFHLLSDPNVFKDWPHYKENIRSGFETLKTDVGKLSDRLEALIEGQGRLMDQGSCEFQMVKQKLDALKSGLPPNERPRMEESTREKLTEIKGEIRVMKQKLNDWMSGPPSNKRPRMEGYSSVELITQLQQMQLDASKGNDETDLKIELKKIASDKGFTIVDNEGSGNCMFYALSDQLEFAMGFKIKYDELRRILVQYLRENPELPDGTNLFNFVHGHQSWDDYLTYMEQGGAWGDHVILCAAANCYKTCIHVVSSLSAVHDVILRPQCPVDKSRTLVLGHIHEVHYVSLHS